MDERFTLQTTSFEGPLEALLNLIESRKLSVSDVSLSDVADSYLAYVEKLPELPLGETAQFILVASTLLLIKSRSLLPSVDLTPEESQSIEELERRLKAYALIRTAAKKLKQQWGTHAYTFPKRAPEKSAIFTPGMITLEGVVRAGKSLVDALPKPEKMSQAVVAPILKLEEVIVRLRERITVAFRARWSELTKSANRHDTIVYFLAMLELVRSGSVSATQEKLFSDILLESETPSDTPKYGTV